MPASDEIAATSKTRDYEFPKTFSISTIRKQLILPSLCVMVGCVSSNDKTVPPILSKLYTKDCV